MAEENHWRMEEHTVTMALFVMVIEAWSYKLMALNQYDPGLQKPFFRTY